jgi:hypothetical protein
MKSPAENLRRQPHCRHNAKAAAIAAAGRRILTTKRLHPVGEHSVKARLTWSGPCAAALVAAMIFSPPAVSARPPRAERAANRIAERRYARLSIAEARAAQAEARVAEIAPLVPVPPPPRPATVRRMVRAGVPLGGPTPPAVAVAPAPQPPRSLAAASPARTPAPLAAAAAKPAATPAPLASTTDPGAWTLEPDAGVAPVAAEVAPDGTRSVLAAGGQPVAGSVTQPPATPTPAPVGPSVTQPAIELLPTPTAK